MARSAADPEELRRVLADDVEWEFTVETLPDLSSGRGAEFVLDFFRVWVSGFTDWGFEARELFEEGDRVIAHIRQWGTGRGSGARVEQDFWQVWTMRDGKAVRVTHHPDRAAALASP